MKSDRALFVLSVGSVAGYCVLRPKETKALIQSSLEWAEKNNGPEAFSLYLGITFVGVVCLGKFH